MKKKAKPELVVRKNKTKTSTESSEKSASVTENGTPRATDEDKSSFGISSTSEPSEGNVNAKPTSTLSSNTVSNSTELPSSASTSKVKPPAPPGLGLLGNYSDSDSDASNSE